MDWLCGIPVAAVVAFCGESVFGKADNPVQDQMIPSRFRESDNIAGFRRGPFVGGYRDHIAVLDEWEHAVAPGAELNPVSLFDK